MAADENGDRTEAATGRRLQRARDEGQAAISPEVSSLLLLGGLAAALLLQAPAQLRQLYADLAELFASAGTLDGMDAVANALHRGGAAALRSLMGLFGMALFAGAAATLVQSGFLFHPDTLLPDLSRLSPGRGLRRILSPASGVAAAKALAKLIVIGAAVWRLLRHRLSDLANSLLREPQQLPAALLDLVSAILLTTLGAQAAIAVLDIVLVRQRHARTLRMSREDVREEQREADGDPHIKARIRKLRGQRARHRMAAAVAKATVVVTNPTHYAVALAYDRKRSAAPKVVAKGMDEMAARIRALAAEHHVPLVANPPLARALHRVELDSDIPAEHYAAVAELIAYVWRLQRHARRPTT